MVPNDGAITLPPEFRGAPVKIIMEKDMEKTPAKKCPVKKGIAGLRGILKGYTIDELENAHATYLTEKYIHD